MIQSSIPIGSNQHQSALPWGFRFTLTLRLRLVVPMPQVTSQRSQRPQSSLYRRKQHLFRFEHKFQWIPTNTDNIKFQRMLRKQILFTKDSTFTDITHFDCHFDIKRICLLKHKAMMIICNTTQRQYSSWNSTSWSCLFFSINDGYIVQGSCQQWKSWVQEPSSFGCRWRTCWGKRW